MEKHFAQGLSFKKPSEKAPDKNELTQDMIKEMFYYNKNTGLFKRKRVNRNGLRVGEKAGTLNSNGYISITINYKRYQAHNLAWLYEYGYFPKNEIDHINRIRNDNRIKNLRDVNRSCNNLNKTPQKNNKSGYTGICWCNFYKKWHARIKKDYRQIHLGYFKNLKEAIRARNEAVKELYN